MSLKTKQWYSEQILNQLSASLRNRDERLDSREIIAQVDNVVNEYAKAGFLENWKLGFNGIGDQYVTTFEWLTVTDPANGEPSYFALPARYVELPKNQGIQDVYFENSFSTVKKKSFTPIIITSFKDVAGYRSNMASNLEGRIGCYPKNGNMYFLQGNIDKYYGRVGVRLVIKDSSAISDTDPYPIDGAIENKVILECVQFFTNKINQPTATIRDNTQQQ